MRGLIVFLVCFILMGSCKDSTPPGILSKAQMSDWMLDTYLAETRAGALTIPRDSVYKLFVPYQDSLLRRKGIQDSILVKS